MNEEVCGREGCGVVLRRVGIFRLHSWVKRGIKIKITREVEPQKSVDYHISL